MLPTILQKFFSNCSYLGIFIIEKTTLHKLQKKNHIEKSNMYTHNRKTDLTNTNKYRKTQKLHNVLLRAFM